MYRTQIPYHIARAWSVDQRLRQKNLDLTAAVLRESIDRIIDDLSTGKYKDNITDVVTAISNAITESYCDARDRGADGVALHWIFYPK